MDFLQILNLGLNDEITAGLAKKTSERFALDCYRRLLDMYGDVVLGIDHDLFEKELQAVKSKRNLKWDIEMNEADLRDLVARSVSPSGSILRLLTDPDRSNPPCLVPGTRTCTSAPTWFSPRTPRSR